MSYARDLGQFDFATLLSAGKAALKVGEDPHLSEVVCQVMRLNKIEKKEPLGLPCPSTLKTISPGRGIGLRHAVDPLRFFVKTRENKYLLPLIVGGGALAVFLVGFFVGRGGRGGRK
jgi:hypothetical protein